MLPQLGEQRSIAHLDRQYAVLQADRLQLRKRGRVEHLCECIGDLLETFEPAEGLAAEQRFDLVPESARCAVAVARTRSDSAVAFGVGAGHGFIEVVSKRVQAPVAFLGEHPIDTPMASPGTRDATALWRVGAFSHQRVPATADYLWDNRERRPARLCVFQYTVEGVVRYRDRDGEREVPPGHAMLFTFGEPSRYWLPSGPRAAYVCDWINLQGAGLPEHWAHLRRRYGSVFPVSADVVAELHRLMAAADPHAGPEAVPLAAAVHRFVMHLFAALTRDLAARQTPVERAIEALLTGPLHPGSLTALARRSGCSREHLCRAFAKRTGRAPGDWQAEQRVQAAVHLLRSTTLSFAEVAAQAGFSSVQTLARQVRRFTGRAPSGLRAG